MRIEVTCTHAAEISIRHDASFRGRIMEITVRVSAMINDDQ